MNSKFYFFGPLLFHTEINKNDLNEINNLCHKDEDLNNRKNLIGHVNDVYKINSKKLEFILDSYFYEYKSCFFNFYGNSIDFYINSAWVNYMRAGEFNPMHFHTGCTLSAVLFLSIPNDIKEENLNFKENRKKHSVGPGELTFFAFPQITRFITERSYFPKEGDLFIFPSNLTHYVAPFKSNVERVSVAFNMNEKI